MSNRNGKRDRQKDNTLNRVLMSLTLALASQGSWAHACSVGKGGLWPLTQNLPMWVSFTKCHILPLCYCPAP